MSCRSSVCVLARPPRSYHIPYYQVLKKRSGGTRAAAFSFPSMLRNSYFETSNVPCRLCVVARESFSRRALLLMLHYCMLMTVGVGPGAQVLLYEIYPFMCDMCAEYR